MKTTDKIVDTLVELIYNDIKDLILDDDSFHKTIEKNKPNYNTGIQSLTKTPKTPKTPKIPNLTKATPWSMYLHEQHTVKKDDLLTLNQQEKFIEIGNTWKSLSNEDKEIYEKRAEIETESRLKKWREEMKNETLDTPDIEKMVNFATHDEHDGLNKNQLRTLLFKLNPDSKFDAHTTTKQLKELIIDAKMTKSVDDEVKVDDDEVDDEVKDVKVDDDIKDVKDDYDIKDVKDDDEVKDNDNEDESVDSSKTQPPPTTQTTPPSQNSQEENPHTPLPKKTLPKIPQLLEVDDENDDENMNMMNIDDVGLTPTKPTKATKAPKIPKRKRSKGN